MQGHTRPVRQVDMSGVQEQREVFQTWRVPEVVRSMLGCAIWPGRWSEKSRPLGPWAESGEKMAWTVLLAEADRA
jgi:hypothetical protein